MYNDKIKQMAMKNKEISSTATKIINLQKQLEIENKKEISLKKEYEKLSKEAEKLRLEEEVKKDVEKKPFKPTDKYNKTKNKDIKIKKELER